MQTAAPFFSIVIPTYNRPNLLRDTLVSALGQDSDDYEVIVSRNHSDDDRTQVIIDEFDSMLELRCFRTERFLSMPKHWAFATSHAVGQYVLILTDRSVLKRHALKTIHASIQAQNKPIELCSWGYSAFDDHAGLEISLKSFHDHATRVDVHALVADFMRENSIKRTIRLPLGLNSCYNRAFMAKVQQQYGSPFNRISPDYFSAFVFMGLAPEVLYIDQPLFIFQGIQHSNGGQCVRKTPQRYLDTLGEIDYCIHFPLNSLILDSLLYDDFLAAQALVGGNLRDIQIDWPCYFE